MSVVGYVSMVECVSVCECAFVSVCWNKSASECVGVCECVCVSVRVFLLIPSVPVVILPFRTSRANNVSKCCIVFLCPRFISGPEEGAPGARCPVPGARCSLHTKPDGPQQRFSTLE